MSLLNDICHFPIVTTITDELGQKVKNESFERLIFCQKKSVSRDEFFTGGQSGYKPRFILVTNVQDYQDEERVLFYGKIYTIYRTYERPDEMIELYCEVKIGDN